MTAQSRICLITRGDDMGTFQAANQAIMDAFRHGILRNTSMMMPAPYIEEAVVLVKQEPDLCLGLHVTLTSEWEAPRWRPILPPDEVPSLLDEDGCFFRTTLELFERGVNIDEMMREVQAQVDLARAMNLDIRYLDEHMGVGWLFNSSKDHRLSDALRALARREGLLWYQDATTQFLPGESVQQFLDSLPGLTAGTYLLITHPACETEEMHAVVGDAWKVAGQLAQTRAHDYYLLCHPQVLQAIQEYNIALVRYDECF